MDYDSSTKFISSLAKFLQSLCNGYVEFDNGVHVIGHLYLSVDTGTTIDYILNEKVCKTDENSVTFVSNSFHAQPAEKPKPASKRTGKDSEKVDSKNDSHGSGQTELKSTNSGTLPSSGNIQNSHGAKRPLSPSQRQSSKSGRVSPRHKKSRTESLEQNLPSHVSNPASENSVSSAPSPAADGLSNAFSAQGTDASQYSEPYQQSFFHPDEENSIGDDSEHQDIKPSIDTDVTFIKEEFASSPSGAQSDSQGRDRTHEEDSSTYPYQSNPVFPGAFTGQGGFVASGSGSHRSSFGASGDRSQMFGSGQGPSHLEGGEGSGDPSDSQLNAIKRDKNRGARDIQISSVVSGAATGLLGNPIHLSEDIKVEPPSSPDGLVTEEMCSPDDVRSTDDSGGTDKQQRPIPHWKTLSRWETPYAPNALGKYECNKCGKEYKYKRGLQRHRWQCIQMRKLFCTECEAEFYRTDKLRIHMKQCHDLELPSYKGTPFPDFPGYLGTPDPQ